MKTALVTGAAARLGRAIAEDLAAHGWAVAIHCHRARREAEALAATITGSGGRATVVQGNLADIDQMPDLVDQAFSALGPLGLLVNNAATFEKDDLGSLDATAWRRQIDINLTAPLFIAEAFAKALPDGEDGSIVNIIDQRVQKPVPGFLSYQVSKSALWAATIAMAQSLAPRIRVNAIGPGPTLPSPRQTKAEFDGVVSTLPLRRGPQLSEFGRTIRYLVDTPSVTGQLIALDGGQHIAWETPDVVGFPE